MSKKLEDIIHHSSDVVVTDWVSGFLWLCWPEHGISPGEAAKVISAVIEGYLRADSQDLPYHFPNAEDLVSKFDFEPNQTVQNENGGGCF